MVFFFITISMNKITLLLKSLLNVYNLNVQRVSGKI